MDAIIRQIRGNITIQQGINIPLSWWVWALAKGKRAPNPIHRLNSLGDALLKNPPISGPKELLAND